MREEQKSKDLKPRYDGHCRDRTVPVPDVTPVVRFKTPGRRQLFLSFTGRRAVMEAEKGKAETSAAVYIALLWAYDLLDPMRDIADPALDEESLTRSL